MVDGTVIAYGKTVNTEENLAIKFPSKFKEVFVSNMKSNPEKQKIMKPDGTKEKQKQQKKKEEKTGSMIDVTANFSLPDGFIVKRDKANGCWVFDGDEEPANDKPLKRSEVVAFVQECVA
jgi:hypothetical protein